MTEPQRPHVFITYAWGSEFHQGKVVNLATELARSCHVELDQWSLSRGENVNAFMERIVNDPRITKVIVICDRNYAEKSRAGKGGVGTETTIMSGEVYEQMKSRHRQDDAAPIKFIPVVFEFDADGRPYTPVMFSGAMYVDMSTEETFTTNLEDLLRDIWERPRLTRPEPVEIPAFMAGPEVSLPSTSGRWRNLQSKLEQGSVTQVQAALQGFLDALCRHFPDGMDPIQALLSGDHDFTLTQEDPMRQNLEILDAAGWITQTFLSVTTPDQPQFRVRIRGTPRLSRAVTTPDVQRVWRHLTVEAAPEHHPAHTTDRTIVHGDVQRLAQSKWGLGEALDDLVREGKRQRLAALLAEALTEPAWTQHVQDWVDTTPSLRALPWLTELILDALVTNLTAEHAAQRYSLINLVMTAVVEGAPHRAVSCSNTLLAGLQAHIDWEDAHWNLLVAGVEPFWLLADRSDRPATPTLLDDREQVVQHLLRAARHAADAGHTQIVNGIWTAVSSLVYDTGDDELLESVVSVRGVQVQQVMTRLTDRTIGELLNAVDHARHTPALLGRDQEMRHRLIDLIAQDTLAYAKQLPVAHDRFEWLVQRAGMALDARGNVISKYVG